MPIPAKIVQRPGCSKVGTIARSDRTNRKWGNVDQIDVDQGTHGTVYVRIGEHQGKPTVLLLSHQATVELATALLRQLNDVTIAVNDDLLECVSGAKLRSDEEAKAVVECVTRRNRQEGQ